MSSLNRRQFLSLSATLSAGMFVAPAILRSQSPNSKLNLAIIGAGGKGGDNLGKFLSHNIVALCDVDTNAFGKAKQQIEKAQGTAYSGKEYRDYRKMFDEVKDYDAVVISTPDHHHYPATIRALKQKKHVYCEKPLTHTIWEARQVAKAAKEAGVATQMGNQGNASEDIRLTTEWIKGGVIGKVKEVHCWSNRPIWPQGVTWPKEATGPVPENLDWQLFLGPAPDRPYYNECHPFKWRGFWDFGTGAFGDMGCHILNWPFTALDLGSPIAVECISSEGATKDSPPKSSTIKLEFAAKGDRPAFNLFWHDGGNLPTAEQFGGEIPNREGDAKNPAKPTQNGSLFIGESGILFDDYDKGGPTLLPRDKMADFKAPEKTLPRSRGHHEEWIDAIGGGKPAGSDFVAKSAALTEMVLLGHLAARVGPGKRVEWDNEAGKVKNLPEANQYVNKQYRPGWI
jgi:predicted dehydrogenase